MIEYLTNIFNRLNPPNELRDWHHFASLEEFRFSAYSDEIERQLITLAHHPRITLIALLARRAVELTGRCIKTHQCPEAFLSVLDELQIALDNRPTKLPPNSVELLDQNLTNRRQWVTHGAWIPPGHALAIIPQTILQMELLEHIERRAQ